MHSQIARGRFHDVDDPIEKVLDALDGLTAAETGALVLAALRASPYPDIELTPPRAPLGNVRDVSL